MGNVNHTPRLEPTVGKVFIAKNRHALAGSTEHVGDLEKQLVAGVKMLAFFVPGILSVLTDQEHTVNGKPIAAES